jgi:DNA-binding Lrp family transcriptional regulator
MARTIMMYDEVESISLMSGSYDLSVTVKGNDLKSIALFVSQRLATIEGVLSTATHFVLKTYKDKGIFIEGEEENDERNMIAP